MTNDEQYVPSEGEMRHAYWLTRMLDHHAAVDAAFDRFIARVRRDAAREAMHALRTHLAASRGYQLIGPDGLDYYIHNHHPEETP